MSLNPPSEVSYRLRLAHGHLKRAERAYSLGDWPMTVLSSQLAIESYARRW